MEQYRQWWQVCRAMLHKKWVFIIMKNWNMILKKKISMTRFKLKILSEIFKISHYMLILKAKTNLWGQSLSKNSKIYKKMMTLSICFCKIQIDLQLASISREATVGMEIIANICTLQSMSMKSLNCMKWMINAAFV